MTRVVRRDIYQRCRPSTLGPGWLTVPNVRLAVLPYKVRIPLGHVSVSPLSGVKREL